jgi:GNAT superfamily N-acetyltransferase
MFAAKSVIQNGEVVLSDQSMVRRAKPDQLEELFQLKREALGKYLDYTIYQTAASVQHLSTILNQNAPEHDLFTLSEGQSIIGYYHGIATGKTYILNYIAVRADQRGRGFGTQLLTHFHSQAEKRNLESTALDVFASNADAHQWYLNQGYHPLEESMMCRFLVTPGLAKASRISCPRQELSAALAAEQALGFSKLVCQCGKVQMTLGLIGGHTCRLISPAFPSEETLSAVLQWASRQNRQIVIAAISNDFRHRGKLASKELSIRMTRALTNTRSVPDA